MWFQEKRGTNQKPEITHHKTISRLDPKVEIDEHDETFLQVSYIIRSLGFMDKLRDYVLQYE